MKLVRTIAYSSGIFVFLLISITGSYLYTQNSVKWETLPLYTSATANNNVVAPDLDITALPQKPLEEPATVEDTGILTGTDTGLYKTVRGTVFPLWTEGSVDQILFDGNWYFVTSAGILFSSDLKTFELRNNGLPVQTIKEYKTDETGEKTKSFTTQQQMLKDIAVHPQNSDIMVTMTKDAVFLTRDGGLNWENIGFSAKTAGGKAVAVASMPKLIPVEIPSETDSAPSVTYQIADETELVVFLSHSIYGLAYLTPDIENANWTDIETGFEMLPTQTYVEEIADILPVSTIGSNGEISTDIYLSQTFIPRIYRLDWQKQIGELLWKGEEPTDTVDGLSWTGSNLVYTKIEGFSVFNTILKENTGIPSESARWLEDINLVDGNALCAYVPQDMSGFETGLSLRELWLLEPQKILTKYASTINDKNSIYIPATEVQTEAGINKYLKIIADNKLNSIVIDMKDDFGVLRYDTHNPLLLEKGYVSKYYIDLDHFVEKMKTQNVYLVARIVVFKDKNLAEYDHGKYAVWDNSTKAPWLGIKGYETVLNAEGNPVINTNGNPVKKTTYYDENWVDPYSEEVWEYNATVAQDLVSRGFDEIQFDYIRFPTDGYNLSKATFRWQDKGMDKESALISFLSYARQNITAPIGIDIYGANGWYRSGARTGQDVELLSKYVDVICPMFYPSHFEQTFLAYQPEVERPYRIYFFGTYRNTVIARNQVLVRPWVQAFYLPVSFDKKYYDFGANSTYVARQIYGVRDSIDRGYMYWNNSGRYDDIGPDIASTDVYPWNAAEADLKYRKPALTGVFTNSSSATEQTQDSELPLSQDSTIANDTASIVSENIIPPGKYQLILD